jgi:hypothetical protein
VFVRRIRTFSLALLASSLLHSVVIGVLLLVSVWSAARMDRPAVATIDPRIVRHTMATESTAADGTSVIVPPLNGETDVTRDSLDELEAPVSDRSLGQLARKRLEAETKRAEALDPEQQFHKLQAASKRLSQLSSDKSVSEMSGKLRQVFELPDRATQPTANADENEHFDPETAQLYDVLKETTDDGQDRYIAVLIDSKGFTSKISLSPEEGQKLHRLMRLIKSNPLLERVYRELAMPLLDQLLKKPTAENTEPIQK